MITDVSFSPDDRALIIQSRDCIASPEYYSVVVHYINTQNEVEQTSLNVSFNTTVVVDLGDELIPDTLYNFSVRIVESRSGVVIDEMSITDTTPPDLDGPGMSLHDCYTFTCNCDTLHTDITDIIPPDSVKPEEEEDGDETLYIAVGVSVVVVVIIIVLAVSVIAVKRNKRMKSMLL